MSTNILFGLDLGPLDRETTAAYTLNITATDNGDPALTGNNRAVFLLLFNGRFP
jgi:hypothetical protein